MVDIDRKEKVQGRGGNKEDDRQETKFPDAGPIAMAAAVLAPVIMLIGALFSVKRDK